MNEVEAVLSIISDAVRKFPNISNDSWVNGLEISAIYLRTTQNAPSRHFFLDKE